MFAPWRFLLSRWPWIGLLSVVINAVLGIALILPVAATLIALPLWGMLFGAIERRRLRMLGAPRRSSAHVRVPREEKHNWLGVRLTEPATWREVGALLLGIALGLLSAALLLAQALALAIAVAFSVIGRTRPPAEVLLFFDTSVTIDESNWWHPLLWIPLILIIAAYANAALAALHASLIGWLIDPRAAEIDRRVDQLTRSRAAIVAAHESERRRIERDLHDGVQQELVGVAARLGMLELELRDGDVDAAGAALRTAQGQTERALNSLRATVRGIHPTVLVDHGLVSAVEELAAFSPLPVGVRDTGFPRLSAEAEAAGYFFVTEAISNAAKHTVASRIVIELSAEGEWVLVSATDDGHGGADAAHGSGLRGLGGRAEALGGTFAVSSPVGGPTRLTMRLPTTTVVESRRVQEK